jgi:hypothetical protein
VVEDAVAAPGAGAGGGASGLVTSTLGSGPQITSFDPVVTGSLQFDHNNILSSSTFAQPNTIQNSTTADFSYLQGFKWGSDLQVGFNNSRSTTNSTFATLSPTLGSNFQARFTQHLLQGFGFVPNTRFIRIAKNNREISDVAFRLQVITTVDQIENIYWDLVYAYENVRVQNESLTFAQKTLSDTQKQVEIGTLAPIETVRAQSTVASDQQQLTLALTNLQLQQLLMKNALSRTLVDPRLADAEVIHQRKLIVGECVPRIVDRHRAGGFAAGGVALVHGDAAEVVLEMLHHVDDRVRPIADPRVQATARGGQQREAGTDLLVADADVAFFVERESSSSLPSLLLSKHARRCGQSRRRGARCEDIASDRIHDRCPPCSLAAFMCDAWCAAFVAHFSLGAEGPNVRLWPEGDL